MYVLFFISISDETNVFICNDSLISKTEEIDTKQKVNCLNQVNVHIMQWTWNSCEDKLLWLLSVATMAHLFVWCLSDIATDSALIQWQGKLYDASCHRFYKIAVYGAQMQLIQIDVCWWMRDMKAYIIQMLIPYPWVSLHCLPQTRIPHSQWTPRATSVCVCAVGKASVVPHALDGVPFPFSFCSIKDFVIFQSWILW